MSAEYPGPLFIDRSYPMRQAPAPRQADFTTVGTGSRGNAWGNSSYCKCPFGRWSRALLTSRTINRSTYFATDLRSAGHKRAVPIHHRPRVGESVRFLRSDSNSPARGSNPPAPARQCGALIFQPRNCTKPRQWPTFCKLRIGLQAPNLATSRPK